MFEYSISHLPIWILIGSNGQWLHSPWTVYVRILLVTIVLYLIIYPIRIHRISTPFSKYRSTANWMPLWYVMNAIALKRNYVMYWLMLIVFSFINAKMMKTRTGQRPFIAHHIAYYWILDNINEILQLNIIITGIDIICQYNASKPHHHIQTHMNTHAHSIPSSVIRT